jgi:hypothetical protein
LRLYSVYDKRNDDLPVVLFETSEACAEAIGVTYDSFQAMATRFINGSASSKKWIIVRTDPDETKSRAEIAQTVRMLRGVFSQEEFARKCGLHQCTISAAEDPQKPCPVAQTLKKIAEAAGEQVSVFMKD